MSAGFQNVVSSPVFRFIAKSITKDDRQSSTSTRQTLQSDEPVRQARAIQKSGLPRSRMSRETPIYAALNLGCEKSSNRAAWTPAQINDAIVQERCSRLHCTTAACCAMVAIAAPVL